MPFTCICATRKALTSTSATDRHPAEDRHKSLDAARIGHEEAVQASRAYRGALTSAIKKKLADVAAEFDRLDRTYGGYGASLQYDEPPPPADPTEAWDWKVTPTWRRAEGRATSPTTGGPTQRRWTTGQSS